MDCQALLRSILIERCQEFIQFLETDLQFRADKG